MSDELKPEIKIDKKCTCEHSTGSTHIECCNICGLPLQKEKWHFYLPGGWQKEKPTKPCYMVHRYKKNDNKPDMYDVDYDDNILCVFNIQDDEFYLYPGRVC